ncbi:MAG: hypothetical protein M0R32_10600 [Candidatus Cloacimonetes bacterium]|jgi:hypothetical protein|nr:hypothetical protein [Candidatus Cloacimonadota bacterium]
MTIDLKRQARVEPLIDGMRGLLSKYLIAHTKLEVDANVGDKQLIVDNAIRFKADEQIIIFDDNSVWNSDTGLREGVEFHTVASDPTKTNTLVLKNPLGKSFSLSDNARIQKAIKYTVLEPKDIYYGDREALTFNEVAVCVASERKSSEWLALGGVSSYEYRLAIMVYVKVAGSGKETDEDRSERVCNCYADAIEDLLIRNIHLDLTIKEVPLVADACIGDQWVFISKDEADEWQPDERECYEVQDNFNTCQLISILHGGSESSSSSSTSCVSFDISTSSRSGITESSESSESISSLSSSSSSSLVNSSSSSSKSSVSDNLSSSTSSLEESPLSSSSSFGGDAYQVYLNCTFPYHIKVSDKAVLRKKERWMYDSRVDTVEYGDVAKGSFMLKAAKLSWFGKETRLIPFPQVGLGGTIY